MYANCSLEKITRHNYFPSDCVVNQVNEEIYGRLNVLEGGTSNTVVNITLMVNACSDDFAQRILFIGRLMN